MLVLSRKLNERILIGDSIEIVVVDIDRNKIRLGIVAPKDVMIMREELLARTKESPGPQKEEGRENEPGGPQDPDRPEAA